MIRELKTFMVISANGTFSAAGDKLGLTQAAVSAQMQRLESELGVTLFDRTGRTARLTLKGRQLVSQAQELLALYDTLGMRTGVNVVAKPVTIGAIASVQRSLLPDVLTRFFKQNPAGRVRVIPGLSMELVNMVDAGELDMAAVLCPPFPLQNGLQWTMLTHEPFRLVVPVTSVAIIFWHCSQNINLSATTARLLAAGMSIVFSGREIYLSAKSAKLTSWKQL
ncbi:LysR family transcriptional regulator [Winslowiella toletana]|uniref:LysR family transcriptional regulator n=1 Tax=Winslowiella toletana TaxID=92490 RepID=UPI0028BE459D|nr:LysR family transcriptional regulator [Winslowiella toletana]WNN45925.1 LysR family transcriptional regulator [Winslowiella toletana]